jgi:hypothetical protein
MPQSGCRAPQAAGSPEEVGRLPGRRGAACARWRSPQRSAGSISRLPDVSWLARVLAAPKVSSGRLRRDDRPTSTGLVTWRCFVVARAGGPAPWCATASERHRQPYATAGRCRAKATRRSWPRAAPGRRRDGRRASGRRRPAKISQSPASARVARRSASAMRSGLPA